MEHHRLCSARNLAGLEDDELKKPKLTYSTVKILYNSQDSCQFSAYEKV